MGCVQLKGEYAGIISFKGIVHEVHCSVLRNCSRASRNVNSVGACDASMCARNPLPCVRLGMSSG